MPRLSSDLAALTADLHSRLARVLEAAAAEGRARALNDIRSLVGGSLPAAEPVRRGPGRPRKDASAPAAPKKRRKSSWAGLTADQRLARINAIRKGKGLPPRTS